MAQTTQETIFLPSSILNEYVSWLPDHPDPFILCSASLYMVQMAILHPIMLTRKMNHQKLQNVCGGLVLEKVKSVVYFVFRQLVFGPKGNLVVGGRVGWNREERKNGVRRSKA